MSTNPTHPGAIKFDTDKPRPELITSEFIEELAKVLAYGAKKYEDRNWEKGLDWSRPFGALMRHMWAWWKGETHDPETGFSHLAHAACNIMFLVTFEERKIGKDNRPYTEKLRAQLDAAQMDLARNQFNNPVGQDFVNRYANHLKK